MAKKNEVPDFMKATKVIRNETARMVATEAVKFFKGSFVKGGFTDSSFNPWPKSKYPMAGKRTLYKRGTLMHSIRRMEDSNSVIVVGTDLEQGKIHNEGGYIVVTQLMKNFFWFKHLEHKGKNKKKAQFFKYMALKEVGTKIKIPQRQFIGHSAQLMNLLEKRNKELTVKEMAKAFKRIRFK